MNVWQVNYPRTHYIFIVRHYGLVIIIVSFVEVSIMICHVAIKVIVGVSVVRLGFHKSFWAGNHRSRTLK